VVEVNQRVQSHPATDCWMRGEKFGTVTQIGRKYIHVLMDRSGKVRRFPKEQQLLIPVNITTVSVHVAPTLPASAVGRKCWYITPSGRKVAAVVDSIDSVTHPQRYNLRITALKDPTYDKGKLINTPPAFVQAR
jgi:hypothetical protein